MTETSRFDEDHQFVKTCVELNLLQESQANSLISLIGTDNRSISETALKRGDLTPADLDIADSLMRPTEIVPGYEILGLIGRGGMGVVYRAKQIDLDRVVALKIILLSEVKTPNAAARFEREAKSLARLQHPNIVQALNFGNHNGRYYFAMEYVPGPTCEQAVRKRGLLPPREAWSIARQIASGLMHALSQGLIHRDIKPANLILVPAPEGSSADTEIVKITDFGLAMFTEQDDEQLKLTTGEKVMGSPAYMSIEQFGGRSVDFRSDMFSLGATLWHLLFGKPPHQGSSIGALYQQKSEPFRFDPSKLPVQIPTEQLQLLTGLLDPDPGKRPSRYEDLIDAIDALDIDVSDAITNVKPRGFVDLTPADLISEQPTVSQASQETDRPSVIADQETQTVGVDSAADARPRSWTTKKTAIIMIATLAVGLAAGLFGLARLNRPERGPRQFTVVVGGTPLFDGVTLRGWDVGGTMAGAWNTVQAPDQSTAIACTSEKGALTRSFQNSGHPRISLFVWLQKNCTAIDVDFAFDTKVRSDVRGCLRITGDTIALGEKSSDFGDLSNSQNEDAPDSIYDRFHVVHLERQPTDWFVFVEEEFVGSLPISNVGDGNAIRLVVHPYETLPKESSSGVTNACAYFSDVQLYQLGDNQN